MQNDFEKMIEKYKAELMSYHAKNPNGGESARFTAPAGESASVNAQFNAQTAPAPTAPIAQAAEAQPEAEPMTEPMTAPMTEPDSTEIPQPQDIPNVPYIPPAPVSTPEMPVILPGEPMQNPTPRVLEGTQSTPSAMQGGMNTAIPRALDPIPSAELHSGSDGNVNSGNSADNRLEDDEGYLQVRVTTAEGAVPLKGAQVVITNPRTNQLVGQVMSNRDGLTPAVPVRTVSRTLSEVEGNPQPYDTYDLEITLDGYFGVKSENVPVFGGITNLQTVSLIPLPEFTKQGEEYTINNPDFSL